MSSTTDDTDDTPEGAASLSSLSLVGDDSKTIEAAGWHHCHRCRHPHATEALAQAAADLLLEVMQEPGLHTRYLRDVPPLVTEVSAGRTRPETH